MDRSALSLLAGLLLAHCAAATPTPREPAAPPAQLVARDAAVFADAAAPDAAVAPAPPQGPRATDQVRALLDDAPVVPGEQAAWMQFELLEQVRLASGGELLATTAPTTAGERVVWSLVAPEGSGHDEAFYRGVCATVAQAVPSARCRVDTLEVGALARPRIAFGWRRGPGDVAADLALPMRALARIHQGTPCLLAAERTLRTLELRVQVRDLAALGGTLALLAMAPHLSELVLIDTEGANPGAPAGAINARLSWSTDRADRTHGDLGDDPWPARCGDRVVAGADAPPRSPLTALDRIDGAHARGAVVNVARHEFLVTDGDQVGDASITHVDPRGVFVRRVGAPASVRPALARFRTPGGRRVGRDAAGVRAQPPPFVAPRLGPVRIPAPPEPPATP